MINSNTGLKQLECYIPNKTNKNKDSNGAIKYCHATIPVKDILCIRKVPNSYIYPKSIITLVVKNPSTKNMPLVTESEFAGSVNQWANACQEAENTNSTINFNRWA